MQPAESYFNSTNQVFPIYAFPEKHLHRKVAGHLQVKDVLHLSSVCRGTWNCYFPIYEAFLGRTDKPLDALQDLTREFTFPKIGCCAPVLYALDSICACFSRLTISPPPQQDMSDSKYEAVLALGLTKQDLEEMNPKDLAVSIRKMQFDIITERIIPNWSETKIITLLQEYFRDVEDFTTDLTQDQIDRARLIVSLPGKRRLRGAVTMHPMMVFITKMSMYREDFFKKDSCSTLNFNPPY